MVIRPICAGPVASKNCFTGHIEAKIQHERGLRFEEAYMSVNLLRECLLGRK